MRRLLPLAAAAIVLLSACGGFDRPEGVVERWLISLNQGAAGEPERYAPQALSERILPDWEDREPGDLDVIEVGKGAQRSPAVLVPYRVERADGTELEGVVVVGKVGGAWQVLNIRPPEHGLNVPSEGGDPVASASPLAWLLAIAAAFVFLAIVVALLALTPKPLALPERRP